MVPEACNSAYFTGCPQFPQGVDFLKFLTDNIKLLITASPILNKQAINDDTIQQHFGRHCPHQES